MELDVIKSQTTWNDASSSINSNFSKIKEAIALTISGGGGRINGLYINGVLYEDVDDTGNIVGIPELATKSTTNSLDERVQSLEGGSGFSIVQTGSGNVITSISQSGKNILVGKSVSVGYIGTLSSLAVSDIPDLSSKYVSLSGGTIKSTSFSPLAIDRDSDYGASAIGFTRKNATLGFIGFNDTTGPKWFDSAYVENPLIHSGNIGSQSVSYASSAGTAAMLKKTSSGAYNVFTTTHESNTLYIQSGYSDGSNASGKVTISGIDVSNLELFRVRAITSYFNGNVGIGTQYPAYILDVSGGIGVSSSITGYSNSTYNKWYLTHESDTLYIQSGLTDGSGRNGKIMLCGISVNSLTQFKVQATNSIVSGTLSVGTDTSYAKFTVQGDALIYSTLTVGGISCNGSINPFNANSYNLGTSSSMWSAVYAKTINATTVKVGTITLTDENGTLKIDGNAYTTGQNAAGAAGSPVSNNVGNEYNLSDINATSGYVTITNGTVVKCSANATLNFSNLYTAEYNKPCVIYLIKTSSCTLTVNGNGISLVNSSGTLSSSGTVPNYSGLMCVYNWTNNRWIGYII